jgi:hypothetical protein
MGDSMVDKKFRGASLWDSEPEEILFTDILPEQSNIQQSDHTYQIYV